MALGTSGYCSWPTAIWGALAEQLLRGEGTLLVEDQVRHDVDRLIGPCDRRKSIRAAALEASTCAPQFRDLDRESRPGRGPDQDPRYRSHPGGVNEGLRGDDDVAARALAKLVHALGPHL